MHNLLEYSDNYSMTSGSLWNYYRDKINNVVNYASKNKSINYKTKIAVKTEARPAQPGNGEDVNPPPISPLNTEVTISLKYFNLFFRSPDLSLINCEIALDLRWSNFVSY